MAMFVHDYGAIDLDFIIYAAPVDPCTGADPDDGEYADRAYLIIFVLALGKKGQRCVFEYTNRVLRDAAWEALSALWHQTTGQKVETDE